MAPSPLTSSFYPHPDILNRNTNIQRIANVLQCPSLTASVVISSPQVVIASVTLNRCLGFVIAVSDSIQNTAIFSTFRPFVLRPPSQAWHLNFFFSVFWWFRPWKPYIFIMHIILADRPGPPESPEPPVHLDHLEHPNSTNMTTNIETVALFSTSQYSPVEPSTA